jgi:hypothetical protein
MRFSELCGTRRRCGGLCEAIFITTRIRARIWTWRKTPRSREPSIDRRTVVSLPFLRWAACTIDTNGALPKRSFATLYLVRSMLSPQLRLLLSFPAAKVNCLIHGAGLSGQ